MTIQSYNKNGELVTRKVDLDEVEEMANGARKKFLLMAWVGDNFKALGLASPTADNTREMSCVEIVEFINNRLSDNAKG